MPRLKFASYLMFVLLAALAAIPAAAQDSATAEPTSPFVGNERFPAPEFPEGLDWLNVPAPLQMSGLRGKIVLLDFWTYGCINCIHMIPVLEKLEAKYSAELIIIGVHSAKFANEGITENIRQIVQRYEIHHPVINDAEFLVWRTYAPFGVNAWPTFAVIDPRGNMFAVQSGEIPFEAFDRVIGGMADYFTSINELDRTPLELALESASRPNTALAFPGKVIADETGGRLFIADTNHNRIIIADLTTYEVLDVIGNGQRGLDDGGYNDATFNKPQGMTLNGSTLYVADTSNHAIRAVDLTRRQVTTIAGTGEQVYSVTASEKPPAETGLNSPWDVEYGDGNLFIAMAGPHQLWVMLLADNEIGPLAGSGREGLLDGTLTSAQLAQPSGLYYSDGLLYFADSESSSIRVADLPNNAVSTLAGPLHNDLFTFGDVDGVVGESRLQHALGVAGDENGLLYVADTYNSKIKLLNPQTREISTLFGRDGSSGFRDGSADTAQFNEPGGLDYAAGRLYVADTNNHAVRVIDLAAQTVSTLTFPNPEALQIGGQATVIGGNSALGVEILLAAQTIQPGQAQIVLNIALPEGYKLNDIAPFTAEWSIEGAALRMDEHDQVFSAPAPELPVRVPVMAGRSGENAALTGDLTVYYCEAVQENLCFIDQVRLIVPVTVSATAAAAEIQIEHVIVPPLITS